MSEDVEPKDVTIPPGSTLTFAAPDGGVEWKMKNTADLGLVIESGDRPILRLTPKGVITRGNMIVDGDIRKEFDCHKFVNKWEIIEGEAPGKKDFAIIELIGPNSFRLTYERDNQVSTDFEYFLFFNARTGTLDSERDKNAGHPDRCISFWDGKTRGGNQKNRIFAMRRGKENQDYSPDDLNKFFLAWELNDITGDPDKGTWGAEPGG